MNWLWGELESCSFFGRQRQGESLSSYMYFYADIEQYIIKESNTLLRLILAELRISYSRYVPLIDNFLEILKKKGMP